MVVSSASSHPPSDLPAVDERLVAPGTRYEIDDGELVYVPPADEPHGIGHGALGALLRAHRAADRSVALDMLTRTSSRSDLAPDASVYPSERDPQTGGRQLEELAFEIVSTERLSHAGGKAGKLVERGVRRVFALDIARGRAFEWSRELGTWALLAPDARIDDPALAVSLPVAPLVDAAVADDAAVKAYRAQRHPEFLAEREEGREEGRVEALAHTVRALLVQRFGGLAPALEARLAASPPRDLDRYLARILTAETAAAVFDA